jgi:hypothetical protein
MVPLLTDENFRGPVFRALTQREPSLDIVRVQDVGLLAEDDPTILGWASQHGRVLLTHDRQTVPYFAYQRIQSDRDMLGVIVTDDRAAPGASADEILSLVVPLQLSDFKDRVFFV